MMLTVLTLYIVLLSPYFQISPNRVTIERTDEFSDINIAYKAIENVYGSSLWFIEKDEIRSSIQNLEKNVKTADITRLYPNGLKIVIESYPPVFQVNFRTIDRNFLLSENGILIPNHANRTDLMPLKVYSPSLLESTFLDYKEAIPSARMKRIGYVMETFKNEFPKVSVTGGSYYRVENEVHLFLENGERIILLLDDSIEKQLRTLKISDENTPGLLTSGEYFYIDARIVGKLFTCKDKPICTKNLEKIYGNTVN